MDRNSFSSLSTALALGLFLFVTSGCIAPRTVVWKKDSSGVLVQCETGPGQLSFIDVATLSANPVNAKPSVKNSLTITSNRGEKIAVLHQESTDAQNRLTIDVIDTLANNPHKISIFQLDNDLHWYGERAWWFANDNCIVTPMERRIRYHRGPNHMWTVEKIPVGVIADLDRKTIKVVENCHVGDLEMVGLNSLVDDGKMLIASRKVGSKDPEFLRIRSNGDVAPFRDSLAAIEQRRAEDVKNGGHSPLPLFVTRGNSLFMQFPDQAFEFDWANGAIITRRADHLGADSVNERKANAQSMAYLGSTGMRVVVRADSKLLLKFSDGRPAKTLLETVRDRLAVSPSPDGNWFAVTVIAQGEKQHRLILISKDGNTIKQRKLGVAQLSRDSSPLIESRSNSK